MITLHLGSIPSFSYHLLRRILSLLWTHFPRPSFLPFASLSSHLQQTADQGADQGLDPLLEPVHVPSSTLPPMYRNSLAATKRACFYELVYYCLCISYTQGGRTHTHDKEAEDSSKRNMPALLRVGFFFPLLHPSTWYRVLKLVEVGRWPSRSA